MTKASKPKSANEKRAPYRVYSSKEVDQFLREDRLAKPQVKKLIKNFSKIFTP